MLWVMRYLLRAARYLLRAARYLLRAARYLLRVAWYSLPGRTETGAVHWQNDRKWGAVW